MNRLRDDEITASMAAEQGSEPTLIPGETSGEYHVAIFGMGWMPGIVISSETVRKAMEAEDRQKEKKQKPPKPPRPNIPIGRIALGNT